MTAPPPQACRPVCSLHVQMLPSSEKTDCVGSPEEQDESFHGPRIAARGLGGRCLAQTLDCQPASSWLWAWLEWLTVWSTGENLIRDSEVQKERGGSFYNAHVERAEEQLPGIAFPFFRRLSKNWSR